MYGLIRGDTEVVTKSIQLFDNIINCVRIVEKCIPQIISHDQQQFWDKTVTSNLNSILIQEAETRQTIRRCFSIICDVTSNTLKLPKIFAAERVPFGRRRIPNAFRKLVDNINALETLEMVAIQRLETLTETIFNLPGAGALTVLDQIKLVEAQLKKCNRQRNDILEARERRRVNMDNLELLIELQLHLLRTKQSEIHELNVKITQFQQAVTHLNRIINASTRSKNLPRVSYHQHVLKSKLRCIQTYIKHKNAKQTEFQHITTTLCECRGKYESEKTLLKELGINSVTANYLEDKLAKLHEDVNKIENEKLLFEKHQQQLGIHGDDYVKFLVGLRRLAIAIKLGCNSYAPIISVLNEIKNLIQCPIEMIESEEESDVSLAERLLLKNAESLWRFSHSVRLCMTSCHHKRSWLIEPQHHVML